MMYASGDLVTPAGSGSVGLAITPQKVYGVWRAS